jgi:gamma-glutamylcyclotransferase (GGCT)/AIG2-like uncharacterized protein YtfP
MNKELYFAYGSNLNRADLHKWCVDRDLLTLELNQVGIAELPDHKLAFSVHSQSRNGGVLDIRESIGRCVEGVLFEVTQEQLSILDRKEGAPNFYQRIKVTVIDSNGNLVQAITYRVNPDNAGSYVQPSEDYLEVVKAGYRSFGISDFGLEAAAANRPCAPEDGFFFYGTLMRGECRFKAVRPFGVTCAILGSTPGRLFDLGNYPAMLPSDERDAFHERIGLVHGEFVRLKKVSSALKLFDAIEGFHGYQSLLSDNLHSLYYRTRVTVDVGEGRLRRAWTYHLATEADGHHEIVSGDWREHRGTKERFINKLISLHSCNNELATAAKLSTFLPFCMDTDRQKTIDYLLPLSHSLEHGIISERRLAQVSGKWTVAIE